MENGERRSPRGAKRNNGKALVERSVTIENGERAKGYRISILNKKF
ncbi:MAG: hypothetical protein LBV69_11725 [Bacteroidales bacterium]|jgi:hypothetical protein|nr:hypothetical protein [Bacteroidales bacterium]